MDTKALATREQLSLDVFGGLDSTVFGVKERKNDKNEVTGISMGLKKRKEIAQALNLDVKIAGDQIDKAILAEKDKLKQEIAKMAVAAQADPNWTGNAFRITRDKKGRKKVAFVLETVSRQVGPTDEETAVKLNAIGMKTPNGEPAWTAQMVCDLANEQAKKLSQNTVDA